MSARPVPFRSDTPGRTVGTVAGMTLTKFARAGLLIKVHSELLDETVLFASDNASIAAGQTLRVFRAADLDGLLRRPQANVEPRLKARVA